LILFLLDLLGDSITGAAAQVTAEVFLPLGDASVSGGPPDLVLQSLFLHALAGHETGAVTAVDRFVLLMPVAARWSEWEQTYRRYAAALKKPVVEVSTVEAISERALQDEPPGTEVVVLLHPSQGGGSGGYRRLTTGVEQILPWAERSVAELRTTVEQLPSPRAAGPSGLWDGPLLRYGCGRGFDQAREPLAGVLKPFDEVRAALLSAPPVLHVLSSLALKEFPQ
jgi:hypothetical protein